MFLADPCLRYDITSQAADIALSPRIELSVSDLVGLGGVGRGLRQLDLYISNTQLEPIIIDRQSMGPAYPPTMFIPR